MRRNMDKEGMVWGSKLEVTLPSLSAVERHELVSADLPLLRTEAGAAAGSEAVTAGGGADDSSERSRDSRLQDEKTSNFQNQNRFAR